MSTAIEAFPITETVPAGRGLRWCLDALRLWRRAPFKLFFMCLTITVVEGAIENIPWVGSWTLHIFVAGMLQYGILLGLDDLAHGRRLQWAHLFGCFRRGRFLRSLALVALCGAVVFGIVQLVVWLAYGQAGIDFMWLGQRMAHRSLMTPRLQEIASLPAIVLTVLLTLCPCLMLFNSLSPWRAFTRGVRAAVHFASPFGVFLLVNLIIAFALSSNEWIIPLGLMFFTPWANACVYAVWHDLRFGAPATGSQG